jgi:hypothetical protein
MTDLARVQQATLAVGSDRDQAVLRLAIAPERASAEVVDVLRIEDIDFRNDIYRLGHAGTSALLSYERAKESQVSQDSLIVTQGGERSRERPVRYVRLELATDGLLLLDQNVTGLRQSERPWGLADHHLLVESDVRAKLEIALGAAGDLYDLVDPHHRYDRLALNASLGSVGHRQWSSEPGPRESYGMRMSGADPVVAFEQPRIVTRSAIRGDEDLVERMLLMLRRKVGE